MAEARVNVGREQQPGPFGDNILQGRSFSVKMSNERAFRFQVNFRSTLGRLFIQESVPNRGTFVVEFVTGTATTRLVRDTAAKSMEYLDGYIESKDVRVGSSIRITFPEDTARVTMGVGSNPSVDITAQLKNRQFTYTESTDHVTFFVFYRNAGGEIVISPTNPLNPDDVFNPDGSGNPDDPGGGTGIPGSFDFGPLPGGGNGLGAAPPAGGNGMMPPVGNGSGGASGTGTVPAVPSFGGSCGCCRCCGCCMGWSLWFQQAPLYDTAVSLMGSFNFGGEKGR